MFSLLSRFNQDIGKHKLKTPKLDLREFLKGDIEGWGVLFNQAGHEGRRFHMSLKGTWKGNKGTLKEWFTFDNGEKKEREWSINFHDDHHYTGEAADVTGKARGEQLGNAAHATYVLQVRRGKKSLSITADDWMYMVDDKTVLNRVKMFKFGLLVGELMLVLKRK